MEQDHSETALEDRRLREHNRVWRYSADPEINREKASQRLCQSDGSYGWGDEETSEIMTCVSYYNPYQSINRNNP